MPQIFAILEKKMIAAILTLCIVGCGTDTPICSENFCVVGEVFPKSDLQADQDSIDAPLTIDEQQFLDLLRAKPAVVAKIESADQVYDGDTIRDVKFLICKACDLESPFPGMIVEGGNVYHKVSVRINGMDTPEIRPIKSGRPEESIAREKELAYAARDYLRTLIRDATNIRIRNLDDDKYFGRVVADVTLEILGDYINVTERMIACGFAVPYDGGPKTMDWGTAPDPTCEIKMGTSEENDAE